MRYYYDCPIKAAYMAKEFGVRYSIYPEKPEAYGIRLTLGEEDYSFFFAYHYEGWAESPSNERIVEDMIARAYVHPVSLHIFELQVGDVVYSDYDPNPNFLCGVAIIGECEAFNVEGWKIIQRNNKAFIWPESE